VDNARDLSAEIVLFLASEKGISKDAPVQVTRKKNLNFSGSVDILRTDVREAAPDRERVRSYKVCELVYTCTFCFEVGIFFSCVFALFFSTFYNGFSNVVVAFCALNFSEETHLAGLSVSSELLQAFLHSVRLMLTETDPSPLEHAGVLS
jgi:hypothetical protein